MAADNKLTARVQPSHARLIGVVAEERGIPEVDAQRVVVREGLEALGYVDEPTESLEVFFWHLRRMGMTLGFVGLICMGYGVFGGRVFSIIGFGLLLTGFLFLALQEGLEAYGGHRDPEPLIEGSEHT